MYSPNAVGSVDLKVIVASDPPAALPVGFDLSKLPRNYVYRHTVDIIQPPYSDKIVASSDIKGQVISDALLDESGLYTFSPFECTRADCQTHNKKVETYLISSSPSTYTPLEGVS